MNHLNEEQLIDVLMEEPDGQTFKKHLADCDICNERYHTLELGLNAARENKPAIPLMPVPRISYEKFRKKSLTTRLTWLAAAAALMLSFSGFRMEMGRGNGGVAISFSLPGLSSNNDSGRVAELEQKLEQKLEMLDNKLLYNDRRIAAWAEDYELFKEESTEFRHSVGFTHEGMDMQFQQIKDLAWKTDIEKQRSKGLLKNERPIQ